MCPARRGLLETPGSPPSTPRCRPPRVHTLTSPEGPRPRCRLPPAGALASRVQSVHTCGFAQCQALPDSAHLHVVRAACQGARRLGPRSCPQVEPSAPREQPRWVSCPQVRWLSGHTAPRPWAGLGHGLRVFGSITFGLEWMEACLGLLSPGMLAVWTRAAAGNCVLVFGEKCLVRDSAGSLETPPPTRPVSQLWGPCRCWRLSPEAPGLGRSPAAAEDYSEHQRRRSEDPAGTPSCRGLRAGGCEELRAAGLSSGTVTQARGLRETGLLAPEKPRAGLLHRAAGVPEAHLAGPAWHLLRGSPALSCPRNGGGSASAGFLGLSRSPQALGAACWF